MRSLMLFIQSGLVLSLALIPTPGPALPAEDPRNVVYPDRSIPLVAHMEGPRVGASRQTPAPFFADVLRIHPAIVGSCAACGYPISATPEPAELLLFGTTLAGVGFLLRRRLRRPRGIERP